MTGIFSGIIGSLIGAGIQAAVGGIPVSEDASKALDVLRTGGLPVPPANWFSPTLTRDQNTQQVQLHEKIRQQVTGAHQVLNSCIRIAKLLEDVAGSHSAAKPVEAWTPGAQFARCKSSLCGTSPANQPVPLSAFEMSKKNCDCRCLHNCETTSSMRKQSENTVGRIKRLKKESSTPKNSMVKIKNENYSEKVINNCVERSLPGSEIISQLEKGRILENDLRDINRKRNKFMNSTKIDDSKYLLKENQSGKRSFVTKQDKNCLINCENKYRQKSDSQTCQICQYQIKNTNKSKLITCGHLFCGRCLISQGVIFKCPICGIKSELYNTN